MFEPTSPSPGEAASYSHLLLREVERIAPGALDALVDDAPHGGLTFHGPPEQLLASLRRVHDGAGWTAVLRALGYMTPDA